MSKEDPGSYYPSQRVAILLASAIIIMILGLTTSMMELLSKDISIRFFVVGILGVILIVSSVRLIRSLRQTDFAYGFALISSCVSVVIIFIIPFGTPWIDFTIIVVFGLVILASTLAYYENRK